MNKFKILDQLIEEAISNKFGTIVERDMPLQKSVEDKTKSLQLPKFALSEKWGDPASDDRAIIERFFNNIQGSTLQEKISSVQNFIKDCDESCINESKVETIIANLVFLDSLAGVIEDFNDQTGGFMFEALLAALIKGTQVTELAGGKLPIEDLIDSDGKTPLSLKFFFKGSKYVKGSAKNLKDGVRRFQKPITYIIGQKEREGKDILGVDFHQFTIGDKSQGIEGDFDVTDMIEGRIYTPNLPDETLIARLDFGSREQLRAIANKYVARLGERITNIFDSFATLTNNLNVYFTNFENKTVGAQAASDADRLAKAVDENID
tara:strand:+ start:1857 stop:2819 length:963 start_codon:yes stop_codon:yes gene_type:complete